MPPNVTVGSSKKTNSNDSKAFCSLLICKSVYTCNREFAAARADAVSRAAGTGSLGGRAFVHINAGKGNCICAYV